MRDSWRHRIVGLCACVVVLGVFGVTAPPTQAELPDERGYELVSPPQKNAGDVLAMSSRTRAAASGDAIGFGSLIGFAGAKGVPLVAEYIARRDVLAGSNGWLVHAITPAQEALSVFDVSSNALQPRYLAEFASDLSSGVFVAKTPLTAGAPNVATVPNIYLRTDLLTAGGGNYQLLSDCPICLGPLPADVPRFQPAMVGASSDFGHVFFESVHNLALGADGTLPKLYEWDHGTIRLAGVLPGEVPAGSSAGGQGAGPNASAFILHTLPGVVSADGTRTFFTAPVDGTARCVGACGIYMRDTHGTAASADDETIQVNAEERTVAPDPPTPTGAIFQTASSGVNDQGVRVPSKVFFTTSEPLTDDDPGASGESNDLYMYDATLPDSGPNNLTRLAEGVTGVIGASDDGTYVYFTANTQPAVSDATSCNHNTPCIFVWHNGVSHKVAAINAGTDVNVVLLAHNLNGAPRFARVTPDGTRMVFRTEGTGGLTGYDHGNGCLSDPTGSPNPSCAEIYHYDATASNGTGRLTCASCNPDGSPATQNATFNATIATSAARPTTHLTHPLSDDGRFVFFTTGERLTSEDRNGVIEDVYEYDAQTGQVHLISSGESPSGSYFLDASADGRDVFFATRSKLVGWDTDNNQDIYDARIDGGVPEPPSTPPACVGEGCLDPMGGPGLEFADFGTAGFDGSQDDAGTTPVFAVVPLQSRERAQWARSGRATLRVRVSQAGRVSVRVRSRIGNRIRIVSRAARSISGGGTVQLRLRLSSFTRERLNRVGALRLRIEVTYSGGGTQSTSLMLHRPTGVRR